MANIVRGTNPTQTSSQLASPWEPFRLMESMLGWNPLSAFTPSSELTAQGVYTPRFDIKETKDSYVFTADLPGIKEDDVDVSLTGNQLVISGQRDTQESKEHEQYHLYERSFGYFSRAFALPDGINPDQVTAYLKDGVLTVTVGKKPEVQPRRIQIKGKAAASA